MAWNWGWKSKITGASNLPQRSGYGIYTQFCDLVEDQIRFLAKETGRTLQDAETAYWGGMVGHQWPSTVDGWTFEAPEVIFSDDKTVVIERDGIKSPGKQRIRTHESTARFHAEG